MRNLIIPTLGNQTDTTLLNSVLHSGEDFTDLGDATPLTPVQKHDLRAMLHPSEHQSDIKVKIMKNDTHINFDKKRKKRRLREDFSVDLKLKTKQISANIPGFERSTDTPQTGMVLKSQFSQSVEDRVIVYSNDNSPAKGLQKFDINQFNIDSMKIIERLETDEDKSNNNHSKLI